MLIIFSVKSRNDKNQLSFRLVGLKNGRKQIRGNDVFEPTSSPVDFGHRFQRDAAETSSCVPFFLPYLHDGVEGCVGSKTEVSAGHIVTYGCRQHAHRDAELLVAGTGLVQLQQGLKGLMVVAIC